MAYRALWVLLAAISVVGLASMLFNGAMQPPVLGIRLVKSAILIAVASILFWKRPRDPVAAVLALAFLCWTITSSVDFTSTNVWPMLLDRLRFLLFALALLLFPDGKWRPRWTRGVAALSIAVFALGVLEAVGLVPTSFFLPLAIGCVLAAILSLILRFGRTSSETQQQQLKWVSFGLVTGVSLILSARAGAALSGPGLAFEVLFQLGIVLVALGFLVPLLRYRLYDAEAVISRSVGYAVLTAALVATFAGSEAVIELLGQQYLGSGIGQISGAIAAALAAVLLAPLNNRISDWAEHRFQRDLVQLKKELPELLLEVPVEWSPQQVAQVALSRIVEAIHATRAAFLIGRRVIATEGVAPRLARNAARELFPLRLALKCPLGGISGWLMIGPRPDGSFYGKDEVDALHAILPAVRRAVVASLERQAARRRDHLFRRRLARQVISLAARIEAQEGRAANSSLLPLATVEQGSLAMRE